MPPRTVTEYRPLSWDEWQTLVETPWPRLLQLVMLGCLITMAFLPAATAVEAVLDLRDVHNVFMIPVIIAATRYGIVAALAAAITGTAAAAFLFYPPYYSLRVLSTHDAITLAVFVIIALITSHLSAAARSHAAAAARNYERLDRLFSLSRRLAAASGPAEIIDAIQEHASRLVGRRVAVIAADETAPGTAAGAAAHAASVPKSVLDAIEDLRARRVTSGTLLVSESGGQHHWLLRPFARGEQAPGVLLVELDGTARPDLDKVRTSVEALLDEAVITLERLDLATTVAKAEVRRQSEALREAIIGSASHSLRTPLASILGSASVLAGAKPVAGDARLAQLAQIIVGEAERLNGDIQKMLDAAALSGSELKPEIGWVDPTDLVNAALEGRKRDLASHRLVLDYSEDLPLVCADPALASSALGLIIDNAARYSQPGTEIAIRAQLAGDSVVIAVEDEGIGLEPGEASRIFDKFYRGSRVRDTIRGTGLGLWIASAFVGVAKGRITAEPRKDRTGTRVAIRLVAATAEQMKELGGSDE